MTTSKINLNKNQAELKTTTPHSKQKGGILSSALVELAVGEVFLALSAPFIKGPLTSFKTTLLSTTLLNSAIRYFEPKDASVETKSTLSALRATLFSQNYLYTLDTLIHEGGHATLASFLYKNARPSITILEAGDGGYTQFTCTQLSSWGKLLGDKNTLMCISAAGAGATLITSLLLIALAHHIYSHYPEIAQYLEAFSFTSCLSTAAYAFSALFENGVPSLYDSHDFVSLWAGGIHPLFFTLLFCSIPFFLALNHLETTT